MPPCSEQASWRHASWPESPLFVGIQKLAQPAPEIRSLLRLYAISRKQKSPAPGTRKPPLLILIKGQPGGSNGQRPRAITKLSACRAIRLCLTCSRGLSFGGRLPKKLLPPANAGYSIVSRSACAFGRKSPHFTATQI